MSNIEVLPRRKVDCLVCGKTVSARVFRYNGNETKAWPNHHGPHRNQCNGNMKPIVIEDTEQPTRSGLGDERSS